MPVGYGGTGVTTFGMNRLLFGSCGNGAISTMVDLTFDGSTLTCCGEFSSYKGMHLVGGSTGTQAPAITVNGVNNVGIGNTTPATTDKLSVTGNTKITGTATIDTNLVVGGTAGIIGTSQFTGNMGVGTSAHDAYKVNVNGTLNATYILIGENPISGSKWTTSGSNIYYNTGNVGIGTTDPQTKLHIRDDTTNTVETCISFMGFDLVRMVRSVQTKRMIGTKGEKG